jgi:transcriptional regulator of acetoin/glycerol metabolism
VVRARLVTPSDRAFAETSQRYIAQLLDRIVIRRRARDDADATRAVRGRLDLSGVVGRSPALAETLEQVALVAPLDVSVLLTGDTGSGKSLLAKLIHDNGPRAPHPFVEINCAALPEQLVESELFGALPGSHSTATRRMEGRVASASRGTLFLDEVGELPLAVQAKLLQLLHAKRYYPLGSTKAEIADAHHRRQQHRPGACRRGAAVPQISCIASRSCRSACRRPNDWRTSPSSWRSSVATRARGIDCRASCRRRARSARPRRRPG